MKISTLLLALTPFLTQGSAWAGPMAYVPNEKSATVSVVDTESHLVVNSLAAGGTGV